MKKIEVFILIVIMATTVYSQDKPDTIKNAESPKVTYQVGKAIITVSEKQKQGKYGEYTDKEFRVEKIYKEGDNWESTNLFNLTESLQLKAAIDNAISEEGVKTKSSYDDVDVLKTE
jgi:hypothetical protein